MRRILILLACLMLAQTVQAAPAHADTSIASLDRRKLMDTSDAGKSIQVALKAKREALQKEANALEKKMRDQQQELIKGRKEMKAEEFEVKKKAFEEEFVKANETIRKKVSDLDGQRKVAVRALENSIAQVTAEIADERKIKMVVDREMLVIVDQSLDVTDEALKRLNAKVTSIPLK